MAFSHLEEKSRELKRTILQIVHDSKASHVGSMFSSLDLMTYLYYQDMNFNADTFESRDRDYFVLSKGHASLANYAILQDLGILSPEELASYYSDGGTLIGHLDGKVPGVEVSTGSMGHGLPLAAGIALGKQMNGEPSQVYCLIGDGECNEGSVWEAFMFLSQRRLANLSVIVDSNKLQGYDATGDIFDTSRLTRMLQSLDTDFHEIDGHDYGAIHDTFEKIRTASSQRSSIVFAHTIKGKGVSYMERELKWHYKSPNEEELRQGLEELL